MIVFILAGYTEVNHALGWTIALTGFMILPLGASFLELVRQAQLETEITNKLINETITVGEGVAKTNIEVDWTKEPPIIYVTLQTHKEIFPNQAALVEEFITRKMGRPFEIIFMVNEVKQVTKRELVAQENSKAIEAVEQKPMLKPQKKPLIQKRSNSKATIISPEENFTLLKSDTIDALLGQPVKNELAESFLTQGKYKIYRGQRIILRHTNNKVIFKLYKKPKKTNVK